MLLIGWASAAGCGGSGRAAARAARPPADSTAPAPALAPVTLVTAEHARADQTAGDPTLETVLVPLHDVEVLARLDGEVVALEVEEGMRVPAGARLARLDDRERRAVLDEREAEVARAEAAWARAQRLRQEQVISEEQFIGARSDFQVARAQRDRAALEWERCTVRAPFACVVAVRRVQPGQMVKQGELLFRVSNPDTLRAELLLPETYLGMVRAGDRVHLVPVGGGRPQAARLTRVNSLVDPASGTFRVVIDFDNRRARLPGGVSVRVTLDSLAARR